MRAASWLLFLAACRPGGIAVPVSHLEVDAEITFVEAQFSSDNFQQFSIANTGGTRATAVFAIEGPYSVTETKMDISARSVSPVVVLYIPTDYDAHEGSITVTDAVTGDTFVVPITSTVDPDLDDDGFVAEEAGGDDCDDGDADRFPGNDETCDDTDNDCDDAIDEDAVDPRTWYLDNDHDTWGLSSATQLACDKPSGYTNRGGDCDDSKAAWNPGADEVWYDGNDQDCDGQSDYDQDGDGHDAKGHGGDDCLDTLASCHPGADEIWYDGLDQDCAGDDDFDQDHDGFRPEAHGGSDCDDLEATAFPGNDELDDFIDQDCDGFVDEDFLLAGDLVVTEVLVDPTQVGDDAGQWLEIWNASARTVTLTGFTLTGDGGSLVLEDGALAPDEVGVFCRDVDTADNGGVTCAGPLPFALEPSDTFDVSCDVVIDTITWTTATAGASWELTTLDAVANDSAASWCAATAAFGDGDLGTPGTTTASCP